jgi:diguanylate cyclase (GGDEF)-like protein/putative nucleotidyltransferase with HDIG domain
VSSLNIIQFVAFLGYVALIIFVINSGRSKEKTVFLIYLLSAAGWSFSSFMCLSPSFSEAQQLFWTKLVLIIAIWSIVAYSSLIKLYVRKRLGYVTPLGYGYLLLVTVLTATGLVHQGYENGAGTLPQAFGLWLILIAGGSLILIASSIFLLINSYRTSVNPDHRNRILYMLLGLAVVVVTSLIWTLEPRLYSINQVGYFANALLMTYAVVKSHLLDIKLVFRKSLVYTGITLFITACSMVLVAIWSFYWAGWASSVSLAMTLAVVFSMSLLFNPLRNLLEKSVNVIFYGKSYDYRQTLLNFSGKISNIIDLDELAEAILYPVINAVRTEQASLLFLKDNQYASTYSQRYQKDRETISILLNDDGPVVAWLKREDRPLNMDIINSQPEFSSIKNEVKETLKSAEVEIICPIKSKQKLIAILVLSKKHHHGCYSRGDTDLLMTLSHEAGMAIENAQLYEKAKQRANSDELTGLFNHRCFHQRMEEEIARSIRFGDVFSLLLLDIDHFKRYNDKRGHLTGDAVLRDIGSILMSSVRNSDICFRYGGDEFAIILPETSIEGSRSVAERIRESVKSFSGWPGEQLTVSIGVSTWPTDGVIKNAVIRAADAALYYSKQTGKNRTNVACEAAFSEVFQAGSVKNRDVEDSKAVLETIYSLASTVDAKDSSTFEHSKKVCRYASQIAEYMGFNPEGMDRIRAASLLHDIGKISIPDQILMKNGPLTLDERQIVQAHPNLGVAIIQHITCLRSCLAGIQYHHERYNGSGYPSGLKGDNIPLDARILAVADSFDAMTSPRPYRNALSHGEAIEELQCCLGTQFDPQIVNAFVAIFNTAHDQVNLNPAPK